MIICKAPYRISLFGGSTDFPIWYHQHGGSIISATLDSYCYISCKKGKTHKKQEILVTSDDINTKSSDHIYHVAKQIMNFLSIEDNLIIHHETDLPTCIGLGSSSSLVVCLLKTINKLYGMEVDKYKLARQAIAVEHSISKYCGIQDQIAAAFGGVNFISINNDSTFNVIPIKNPDALSELSKNLFIILLSTKPRKGYSFAKKQIENIPQNESVLRDINNLALEAYNVISKCKDFTELGKLLNVHWELKKSLYKGISNEAIDTLYNSVIADGALGGKLLGAGGAGAILFYAEQEQQNNIKARFKNNTILPIKFEYSGATIL